MHPSRKIDAQAERFGGDLNQEFVRYQIDIQHYPVLFEVCGIQMDGASLSSRIRDIFRVPGNCVE